MSLLDLNDSKSSPHMNRLSSFQLALTRIRERELNALKRENSVLHARVAYLRTFNLQGRVRGTHEAHNLVQRGPTPRPATPTGLQLNA